MGVSLGRWALATAAAATARIVEKRISVNLRWATSGLFVRGYKSGFVVGGYCHEKPVRKERSSKRGDSRSTLGQLHLMNSPSIALWHFPSNQPCLGS